MKELDGVIEIECQMIQIKQGADVDIGANASAEEADEELEDGVVIVNNVVSAFRLQDTTFDKKQYTFYLKGYMKAIKAKIQEAAAKNGKDADAIFKAFETSAQAAAKKILGNFKDYKLSTSWGQTVGGELEDLDWLELALKSYGHHIRHLTINSARMVEILASHPHICQGLICDTVPQMRRFKPPATLDGANEARGLCLGLGRKWINDTPKAGPR
ncbi:hypothetical protein BG003_003418 [Podila horticola]|nr:hypothetical protein BG003_003418 [Podila horticola]